MKRIRKHEILSYPAVFSPAEKGRYAVSFPDFPGCVTFGKNFEHAKEMASEVLTLWLEELRARRQTFPKYK